MIPKAVINYWYHVTYLEPINGAAINKRREFPEAVTEGISNGAHGQHNVKLVSDSRDEQIEEGNWCSVRLFGFVTLSVRILMESYVSDL
jgi:hypothetical protein